ncbi:MAG: methyltransferase domain-containing protein [Veillonellales bacterium]
MITVGLSNESNRTEWIRKTLAAVPKGWRILDAGAGEQQFKRFCSHLDYVAQDFGQYDGCGDGKGLQMGIWDQTRLDIVSDITSVPEFDASFDAIMCTEVFEHLPEPSLALKEFSRLLCSGGKLILTAPFCSLTHFAPYHFSTGFNQYWYEYHLPRYGLKIVELAKSGNYFEYLAQEIRRIDGVSQKYANQQVEDQWAVSRILEQLQKMSTSDLGSAELLCFGYHVLAEKE